MLDRVVDEISHGIEQKVSVAARVRPLPYSGACLSPLQRHQTAPPRGGQCGKVHGAPAIRSLASICEIRVSEANMRRTESRAAKVTPISAWSSSPSRGARIGLFQPPAHTGQRRPRIVRHTVGDLLHLPHQSFNAVKHQIEVGGQLIPFISGPFQGNSLARPLCMIARLVALMASIRQNG
jgi:hypothetical protein